MTPSTQPLDDQPGLRLIFVRGRLAVIAHLQEIRWRKILLEATEHETQPAPAAATIVAARAAALNHYKPEPEPITEALNLAVKPVRD